MKILNYKIDYHFVVYRYEAILALIILLLTGSIAMSSKDPQATAFPPQQRYPFSIALTFDDGPHPVYTDRLVKLLRENNVQATFFVVGSQAVKYPELLKELSQNGHELENHTMTHPNLKTLKEQDIKKELLTTQSIIRNITGQNSLFFRPPGGQFNAKVLGVSADMNLDMVLWTVFPKDHQMTDPEAIKRVVLSQSYDGGVIILHSGLEPTLVALPGIISELKNRGYRFVTVSQLKSESKNVQLAWLK